MRHLPKTQAIRSREKVEETPEAFRGFALPTSNTTYTPNQFFDVCLRHYSRGVVRLVGYLIRQTLGWCDAEGNPLHERLQVSYRELIERAGISRGLIRRSLDEAITGRFIECVQEGKAATAYSRAESAHYQLRWDDGADYVKDPERFDGFFGGEGNRTDIPNQFFDHLIPNEPLSVTKVVGSIIRFSIGFQAKHGRRRQQVSLSYRDIERYARMNDTHTLAEAIRTAEAKHYILKLQDGVFDPDGGKESRPALFTLRWADTHQASPFASSCSSSLPSPGIGPFSAASSATALSTGSKTPAADFTVEKMERFKNPSETGSESPAADRFIFPSGIETKFFTKEIGKQQQEERRPPPETPQPVQPVACGEPEVATQGAFAHLKKAGFREGAARFLSTRFPEEQIRQQIEWLPQRGDVHNPLGMLRRAIEENWPAPEKLRHAEVSESRLFAQHFYAGLAGNPGLPVAEPSARDIELADGFIQRLQSAEPLRRDPTGWGREFAAFVRERRRERDVASLVLALRLHGDGWLLRFRKDQETARAEIQEARRSAHRLQHELAWFEFIADAEQTCRTRRNSEYQSFLNAHESSRWQVSGGDVGKARLLAFQRRFQLPDFWQWDAEFNPQPYQPNQTSISCM
jgi:hypothetical protein